MPHCAVINARTGSTRVARSTRPPPIRCVGATEHECLPSRRGPGVALNWIVPGRRAVVALEGRGPTTMTYRDVVDAWITQLGEHRDKLLEWYRPLADAAARSHLDAGFDDA